MSIILFDTETTGLLFPSAAPLFNQPHIIEICCRKYNHDLTFIEEINTLIDPLCQIPKRITELTGIDYELVQGKGAFAYKYNEIADFFLGSTLLIAHNISFDVGMLSNELRRLDKLLNFPWPKTHFCTAEWSKVHHGHRLKLAELAHQLGCNVDATAHRAKNDVLTLENCVREMMVQRIPLQ